MLFAILKFMLKYPKSISELVTEIQNITLHIRYYMYSGHQLQWNTSKTTMATTLNKFFTYVTKTRANLSTYIKKPESYNGTIIFEIDIMKKSSPTQFKIHIFCHCENQNNTSFLLDSQHSQLSFRGNRNKRNNQKICEKVKFDKDLNWLGRTFSWYQPQK